MGQTFSEHLGESNLPGENWEVTVMESNMKSEEMYSLFLQLSDKVDYNLTMVIIQDLLEASVK